MPGLELSRCQIVLGGHPLVKTQSMLSFLLGSMLFASLTATAQIVQVKPQTTASDDTSPANPTITVPYNSKKPNQPRCSTEITNGDCYVNVNRLYPYSYPGFMMKPHASVTVNVFNPFGFEKLTLELSIDLYVIRPAGSENPPVGMFLLNYTFDTNIFRQDYWCGQAKQNGLAIVGFGSALSWERFHSPRPMKEWFVSELQEALSTSTHDVQMVLNYLETRKDLDMKHVGMYGQGSGGAVAILAAAVNPRITAVDVTDPWGDWPDWLKGSKQIPEDERAAYLKPEFLQKVANLDFVTYLPQLKLKSLRIQQVTDDLVTSQPAKDKIAKAAPDTHDVVHYQDHEAQHKAVFLGGITEWLSQQLHPGTVVANQLQ